MTSANVTGTVSNVQVESGRRERKKLATRQAIADAAMGLFLDRGYDAVTVADIARAADVAVSTLFSHFDSKEAIAFARGDAVEHELQRVVRDRRPGQSITQALRDLFVHAEVLVSGAPKFVELVRRTPALTAYSDRMWSRHAAALAAAIASQSGWPATDLRVRAWTRLVVQLPSLVRDEPDRAAAIDAVLDSLATGWSPDAPADDVAVALCAAGAPTTPTIVDARTGRQASASIWNSARTVPARQPRVAPLTTGGGELVATPEEEPMTAAVSDGVRLLDELYVDRHDESPEQTWQRLMTDDAVVRMDGTTHRGRAFVDLLTALRSNIRSGTVEALEEVEQTVDGIRHIAGRYLFVNNLADGTTLTGEEHIFLALDPAGKITRLVGVTRPVEQDEDFV